MPDLDVVNNKSDDQETLPVAQTNRTKELLEGGRVAIGVVIICI